MLLFYDYHCCVFLDRDVEWRIWVFYNFNIYAVFFEKSRVFTPYSPTHNTIAMWYAKCKYKMKEVMWDDV